jgi:hypothetical protein
LEFGKKSPGIRQQRRPNEQKKTEQIEVYKCLLAGTARAAADRVDRFKSANMQ